MDYDKFKKDYEAFEEWNNDKGWEALEDMWADSVRRTDEVRGNVYGFPKRAILPVNNDGEILHPFRQKDMVNSPAHYTRGKQEAIEIIEEAIKDAPDVKAGMLQAQTLKYLLRLWLKGNSTQDAEKSRWYLNRLIEHLSATLKE
jgi:hypothetical protein